MTKLADCLPSRQRKRTLRERLQGTQMKLHLRFWEYFPLLAGGKAPSQTTGTVPVIDWDLFRPVTKIISELFFCRKLQFTSYDFIIIYIVNCSFLLAGLFHATEMLSSMTAFLNQTSWKLAHKTLAIIYKQKDWQEGVLCEMCLTEELAPHPELK